ncbi:hypothetical protein [Bradyrhizobium sp. AUGA SZCCT0431]|uniref:hypothetical protein n=1 Tax=Bradyrhizobium sp. AUGA SZCCT0431 TaxID=2807674 RepID=UPI001BAC86BC|nr:hypothetical protein [Bradyrhizobium sp. AUGA SZCCT0431]MBR1145077.1 hypothetical protein [Bradyrhizobium sp. AUGA SZCCT0431]
MAIKQQPLDERIEKLRADIDAFIDARVEAMKSDTPGIPAPVLRQMIIARAIGCQCSQYRFIKQQDDRESAA